MTNSDADNKSAKGLDSGMAWADYVEKKKAAKAAEAESVGPNEETNKETNGETTEPAKHEEPVVKGDSESEAASKTDDSPEIKTPDTQAAEAAAKGEEQAPEDQAPTDEAAEDQAADDQAQAPEKAEDAPFPNPDAGFDKSKLSGPDTADEISIDKVREGIVGANKLSDTQRINTIDEKQLAAAKQKAGLSDIARAQAEKDKATEAYKAKKRSAEDDKIVAVIVFVDEISMASLGEKWPSPFSEVAGVTLLRRSLLALVQAELTHNVQIICPKNLEDRTRRELKVPGLESNLIHELKDAKLPEQGRVVIVDPRTFHDPATLKRLAQWRGLRVAVACSRFGDGFRLQVDGVRVREIGLDLVPFDGSTAGAISIPVELLDRLLESGYSVVLRELVLEELLGASVSDNSESREIHTEKALKDVRQRVFSTLVLNTDGLMDRFVNRRISIHITRSLYQISWIKPSMVTALACFCGLLAGPLLSFAGSKPVAVIFAAIALWLSVIFDCVDGELARLRMEESKSGRIFDRFGKTLVHMSVLTGIVGWFHQDIKIMVPAVLLGLGFLISAFVSMSQKPRLPMHKADPKFGDRIDGFLLNRNFLYLTVPIIVVVAFLPDQVREMVMLSMLGAAAVLVHLSWLTLKIVGTEREVDSR